jgi:hypothetical protein
MVVMVMSENDHYPDSAQEFLAANLLSRMGGKRLGMTVAWLPRDVEVGMGPTLEQCHTPPLDVCLKFFATFLSLES